MVRMKSSRRPRSDTVSTTTLEVDGHVRAFPTQTTVTLPKDLVRDVLAERHAGWSHARDMEAEVERLRAERDRERERADRLERGIREIHRPTRLPSGADGACRVCLYAYPCPTLRLLDTDGDSERGE